MPKEDTNKLPLALEDVVRVAREMTLKDGYHVPTVIADGSRQRIVAQIEHLASTPESRVQQLFHLGIVLAEHADFGALQQAFLITEAWIRAMTPRDLSKFNPGQTSKRREILVISRLALQPLQTEVVVFEMKRDANGKLISLDASDGERTSERAVSAENPLLQAFVVGFLGSTFKFDD